MSEVVIFRHPERPIELVVDTDDIAEFEAPIDVLEISCAEAGHERPCGWVHRRAGTAHLNLTFKPGKMAVWREVAEV